MLAIKSFLTSKSKALLHIPYFNYRILFFGSDIISKEILLPLHTNFSLPSSDPNKLVSDLQIVTHHKSATSFRTQNPIHDYCQKNKLIYHEPLTSKSKEMHTSQWTEFIEKNLIEKPFDLGIACSFGYMIPNNLIDKCSMGIIIIHPSLLPKYRGAAPIYHALLQGDIVTGVSFIDISKNKFDAGQMLLQSTLSIHETWNYKDLALELGKLAGKLILNVINDLQRLREKAKAQNENEKTNARKIKPEETFANWENDNPSILKQKSRAFSGSNMHALKTIFDKNVIFIEELNLIEFQEEKLLDEYKKLIHGGIYLIKGKKFGKYLYVRCKDGWVKITKWRVNNQSRDSHMFIQQFLDKDLIYNSKNNFSPYIFTNFQKT